MKEIVILCGAWVMIWQGVFMGRVEFISWDNLIQIILIIGGVYIVKYLT